MAIGTNIIEEHGYFWWHDEIIPEGLLVPESSVTGTITISDEGHISLELDGFLSNPNNPFSFLSGDNQSIPPEKHIQGILKNTNQFVLLTILYINGGKLKTNGISYESYLAINCLIGKSKFLKTNKPLQISKLQVNLKGFENWLRLGSIETIRNKSSLRTTYKTPKKLSHALDDGTLSIDYDILGSYFTKQKKHSLNLKEEVFISYTPKKRVVLNEIKKQYGLIEDLLILLTNSDYNLDWPFVSHGKKNNISQLFFLKSKGSSIQPNHYDSWTNFIKIRDNFGQIFSEWRKKREFFGPGFYLYLGTKRGINLYAEHHFVNLIWGIESLHRKKVPESKLAANLESKINRILDKIELKRDKAWLENRLKHANEPTLEKRIYETFENLPIKLDKKRLQEFSTDCAHIRNDISHFGGRRDGGEYGDFLNSITQKTEALSYLYHCLLLQEIGIDEEQLKYFMFQGYRSYRIKEILAKAGLIADA